MVKFCIEELYESFKQEVNNKKFVTHCKTTKLSLFARDKSVQFNRLLYRFTCQGCGCNYINKTERTSHERTSNHAQPNKNMNDQNATYEDL